jgi:hypothetical protein
MLRSSVLVNSVLKIAIFPLASKPKVLSSVWEANRLCSLRWLVYSQYPTISPRTLLLESIKQFEQLRIQYVFVGRQCMCNWISGQIVNGLTKVTIRIVLKRVYIIPLPHTFVSFHFTAYLDTVRVYRHRHKPVRWSFCYNRLVVVAQSQPQETKFRQPMRESTRSCSKRKGSKISKASHRH